MQVYLRLPFYTDKKASMLATAKLLGAQASEHSFKFCEQISSKGKILQAVKNFNGPFITPKLLFVRKWLYLYTVLKTVWHHFFILFLGGGERGNYKKHVCTELYRCVLYVPILIHEFFSYPEPTKSENHSVWWVTKSHERNKIPRYITDLPKKAFKRVVRKLLLDILEKEDDYIKILMIIKKVGTQIHLLNV